MRMLPRSRGARFCAGSLLILVMAVGFLAADQEVQFGQEDAHQKGAKPADLSYSSGEIGAGIMLLRTFFSLVAVIALVFLAAYGLKKFILRRGGAGGSQTSLKVVGSTFLGPKKAVYLVQVIDRMLILGVTDNQVTLLSEITDPETLSALSPAATGTPKRAAGRSFSEHLASLMKGMRKNEG